jgi:hypothetical protein
MLFYCFIRKPPLKTDDVIKLKYITSNLAWALVEAVPESFANRPADSNSFPSCKEIGPMARQSLKALTRQRSGIGKTRKRSRKSARNSVAKSLTIFRTGRPPNFGPNFELKMCEPGWTRPKVGSRKMEFFGRRRESTTLRRRSASRVAA